MLRSQECTGGSLPTQKLVRGFPFYEADFLFFTRLHTTFPVGRQRFRACGGFSLGLTSAGWIESYLIFPRSACHLCKMGK